MAQIGDLGEKKWKVYIVNKADDPPTASTKFTDYTGYFVGWGCTGSINKLASFVGTLIDINTTTKRGNGLVVTAATIDKGNLIYVMSGTKLIGKFVIQKPQFSTDFTVEITAIQSTGSEIINRQLANENMPKIAYQDITFNSILTSTSSTCQGILVDGAEHTILSSTISGGALSGASDKYSLDYDYDNRMKAVDKLVNTAGKEWWLDYGTNDITPYSEGDTLNIASRQGSATSTKTFYFSSANMNAKLSEGGEETETNANHIILEGQDQSNNQIVAETYDATGNYTPITAGKSIDGWLAANISDGTAGSGDPGETYITLTSDSLGSLVAGGILIYSGGIVVRIDNETIHVADVTTAIDGIRLNNITRGYFATEKTPHSQGADVIFTDAYNGGVEVPFRIYVDQPACICQAESDKLRIGNDTFYLSDDLGSTHGATYLNVLRPSWESIYAHGDKTLVREASNWCPANPHNMLNFGALSGYTAGETITGGTSLSTGTVTNGCISRGYLCLCNISGDFTSGETVTGSITGSMGNLCIGYHTNSIQQDGLFSKTLSDNLAKNRHMLDLKAQRILLTKRLPIKRIVINVINPVTIWGLVSLGDTITLGDGSKIGFEDNEEVRVTGWEYSFEEGIPNLQLFCNDKETRTYASTQTNYVQEKITSEQPNTQEPLRTYGNADAPSTAVGSNATWAQGYKQITQVMTPIDDFDAANKKYVDDITPAPSVNYWCRNTIGSTYVKTCYDDDILPNFIGTEGWSGSCIGRSTCRWPSIWGYQIDGQSICAMDGFYGNGANITHTVYQLLDNADEPVEPSGTNINEIKLCGTGGITTTAGGGNQLYIDGSGITCWQAAVGAVTLAIQPNSSRSLYPLYANYCNVGLDTCKWNSGYFSQTLCAGNVYSASTVCGCASGRFNYCLRSCLDICSCTGCVHSPYVLTNCLCVCNCIKIPVGTNMY